MPARRLEESRLRKMIDKKAIMLRFLTTLLLALFVFGFAGCVAAKYFRLSSQAETNFAELAEEVIEVSKSPLPLTRPFVFIQDADTYVYFVDEATRRQNFFFDDNYYAINYPAECEKENCLCLCQKFEDNGIRECNEFVCKEMPNIEFSRESEIIAFRSDEDPRRQTVRVIKCAANTPYCRGNTGEVSVIFDLWDDRGAYSHIK